VKVVSAEFVTSASASGAGVPRDGAPQIALAGRSNVGKSSLINALTRRKIARTSAAPGKTRLANIYRVELEGAGPGRLGLYLVDLPGYGYARGGPDAAAELKAVAEAYFSGGQRLRPERGAKPPSESERGWGPASAEKSGRAAGIRTTPAAALLLIDSRHPGLSSDVAAAEWLRQLGVGTHLVATKIDTLTRSERARNLTTIGDTFGMAALPVSAASGEGLDDLWRMIARIVRDAGRDA
jgi:GTP-binding protein